MNFHFIPGLCWFRAGPVQYSHIYQKYVLVVGRLTKDILLVKLVDKCGQKEPKPNICW